MPMRLQCTALTGDGNLNHIKPSTTESSAHFKLKKPNIQLSAKEQLLWRWSIAFPFPPRRARVTYITVSFPKGTKLQCYLSLTQLATQQLNLTTALVRGLPNTTWAVTYATAALLTILTCTCLPLLQRPKPVQSKKHCQLQTNDLPMQLVSESQTCACMLINTTLQSRSIQRLKVRTAGW